MKCLAVVALSIGATLGGVLKMHAESVTPIYSFSMNNGDGATPQASLTLGPDGNFYGTTVSGGNTNLNNGQGYGTVFKVTTNGTLTTLVSFSATNGANPFASLTLGPDGNFYGTTSYGGNSVILYNGFGDGTVFKVTTNGTLTTLVNFNMANGANPQGSLTLGPDGNFYGTTIFGGNTNLNNGYGYGTVFEVTTNGTLTTLASFSNTNGANPQGGLALGPDDNLYGTAISGGNTNLGYGWGFGTVFKVTTNGTLTTLVTFNNANGANPSAKLTLGPDGNFYGTTGAGGNTNFNSGSGYGTVFKMTTNGELTTLVSFSNTNGDSPSGLTKGPDGNFYGTTYYGGNTNLNDGYGYGSVFQVTTNGTLTTLANFNSFSGINPHAALTLGPDGSFYGTTESGGSAGYGTVFRVGTTPYAATATASVTNGFVVSAMVTDPGFGYTNTPLVYLVGGGGSGARAFATISNGMLIAITITNAGFGYTNAPAIAIMSPFPITLGIAPATSLVFSDLINGANYQFQVSQSGVWNDLGSSFVAQTNGFSLYVDGTGTGSLYRLVPLPLPYGAAATPILDNGFVVGATVTIEGSGYSTVPQVEIIGGGGSGAQAMATVSNGMVTAINILDAGFGYINDPTIQIAPPPQVEALAPAVHPAVRLDYAGLAVALPYQLQTSANLTNWTNCGTAFTASANTNSQYMDVTNSAQFFRLVLP